MLYSNTIYKLDCFIESSDIINKLDRFNVSSNTIYKFDCFNVLSNIIDNLESRIYKSWVKYLLRFPFFERIYKSMKVHMCPESINDYIYIFVENL